MPEPQPTPGPWRPSRLVNVIEQYDTSTGTTKIETDEGMAYIKVLGNRQGPHVLASEWVGSSLARWFDLDVPDFWILDLPADACFDLPRRNRAQPGPAFVSRHVPGSTWSGDPAEISQVQNRADVSRLVVFDTWVRNCDRHPPDLNTRKPNYANVYLADADRPEHPRLVPIDHTHCFDCGRDFTPQLSEIDKVRDQRSFGLFPAFAPMLNAADLEWCRAMLQSLTRAEVEPIVANLPAAWEVAAAAARALCEQILQRAIFVANRIEDGWPLRAAPDTQT